MAGKEMRPGFNAPRRRFVLDDGMAVYLKVLNSGSDDQCVVCREKICAGCEKVFAPCGHDFHSLCVRRHSMTCPVCGLKIFGENNKCSTYVFTVSKITDKRLKQGNQLECAICQENFCVGDYEIFLPCIHTFHSGCVSGWFGSSTKCPICRMNIGEYLVHFPR